MRYPIVSLFFASLLVPNANLNAQGPDLAAVLEAWRARNAAFTTIRYRGEGKSCAVAGSFTGTATIVDETAGPTPADDMIVDAHCVLLLDFGQGRAARRRTSLIYDGFAKGMNNLLRDKLFDGNEFQVVNPDAVSKELGLKGDQSGVDVAINTEKNLKQFFEPNDFPILFSHGVFPTENFPEPRELRGGVLPTDLSITSQTEFDGRPHLVLRSPPRGGTDTFHEYWVDPSRQAAVSRWLSYVRGNVRWQFEAKYTEQGGHWLPASWRLERLSGGNVDHWEEMTLEPAEVNPAVTAEDFHVRTSAGQVVQDNRAGSVVRKGETPAEDVDLNVERAREQKRREGLSTVTLISLIGGALILAGLAFYVIRNRNSSK